MGALSLAFRAPGGGAPSLLSQATPIFNASLLDHWDARDLSLSNGASIPANTWIGRLGNYYLTQQGSIAVPTFAATGWATDSGPAVVGSGTQLLAAKPKGSNPDAAALIAGLGNVYTIAMLLRRSGTGYQIFHGLSDSGGNTFRYGYLDNANAFGVNMLESTAPSKNLPALGVGITGPQTFTDEDALVVCSSNGTSSLVYGNGQTLIGDCSGDSAVTSAVCAFFDLLYHGGAHPSGFVGAARKIGIWTKAFTYHDLAALEVAWA